ncbi:MAG: L-threonylcarbamoyladenylate synthase, partial [Bacteroidota bacterium]
MPETIEVNLSAPDEATLKRAAEIIHRGGLVVYPTETLYGIGADATNPAAVGKVQLAKQRRENKPILVIVHSRELMMQMVDHVPRVAEGLIEKFWPGPLTIVFQAKVGVSEELTQATGTIGIRIPSSELCLRL